MCFTRPAIKAATRTQKSLFCLSGYQSKYVATKTHRRLLCLLGQRRKQPPGRTHRVNDVKVGILNDGAKDLVEGRADEENEERKGHPQPAEENEEYGPSETSSTTALNGETRLVYFDVHSTVSALLFD